MKKAVKMEEAIKAEETAKREYSIFNNYWYLYKGFFRNSRWNILFVVMMLVGGVGGPYVNLYLAKTVVSLVMEEVSLGRLVGTLALMELAHFLLRTMAEV